MYVHEKFCKRPRPNTIFKYIKDTVLFFLNIMLFKVFENRLYIVIAAYQKTFLKQVTGFYVWWMKKIKRKKVELPTIYFNHFVWHETEIILSTVTSHIRRVYIYIVLGPTRNKKKSDTNECEVRKLWFICGAEIGI